MKGSLTGVFLLLIHLTWAQSGPGGVGNAVNNVLWMSADNSVYSDVAGTTPASDGNNVAVWGDRSGNGNSATHATAGERPNFETSIINGLPVIRFTAANGDRLLTTLAGTSNEASIWAVASWATLPSQNPGIIQASPSGLAFTSGASDKVIGMWVSSGTGNYLWGRGVQADNTAINIPQTSSTSVNTFYSFLNLYSGTQIMQYVNSVAAGSAAYNGTLRSWSDFGIGRQAGESWNGDIAEVIVYNMAVNSAQRIIINNYLSAKYNLPLSTSNVYTQDDPGQGNFDHEVAGIGQVDASSLHADARGSGILRVVNPTHLGNNEFFMWGHDNGSLQASVTVGLPAGVTARLGRLWRLSEAGDVGNVDLEFDLSGVSDIASMSACDAALALRLLVDIDNDNDFSDQTPIGGATNIGGNVYRFANVGVMGNNMRFTLAIANPLSTGPGGVGSTDGSSTLKLWFRTDNGVNATGSAVDSWSNSAGVAALDISETGTQRPTLVAGTVNGFGEISFNGANRLRTGLTLTTTNFVTNEASSFVVNRADNTTQNSSVYVTDPLEINRFANHIPWSGTVYYDIGDCCGSETRLEVGGLTGLTGYSVWSYDANPTSGKQLYRNGSQLQNRASTSTYSSHATHRFNIGGNTSGTAGFEGDITEVVIFNRRVNSAQRILIQNYLAAKYALSLAANDVYTQDDPGAGDFDYDVAGIGRVSVSNIHSDAKGTGIVRVFNPSNLDDNEFLIWGRNNAQLSAVNTADVPVGIQGRLSRVWRVSESGNVGATDMQFDLSGLSPITASDLRLLIDHNGDGVFAEAGTLQVAGAVTLACGNYLFQAVPGASIANGRRFTIGTTNISQTPLPIVLRSFSGKLTEGATHLKWTTLSELNNHFFTVERSLNGKDFIPIAEVPGSGTTKTPIDYEYTDSFVPFGRLYYRLKQTDYDGVYSYSDVIALENKSFGTQLIAIPNPVSSGKWVELRINHPEKIDMQKVSVSTFDLVGRHISVSTETGVDGGLLMRVNSHSGIYIIRVISPELPGPLYTRIYQNQ